MSETTHTISVDQLVGLAIEHWRLSTELSGNKSAAVNHALRKIEGILTTCEIEPRDLNGQPCDPGLAARVVDEIDDGSLAGGAAMIIETVCPMVLYRGKVVRSAAVVIAKNPG